MNSPTAEFARTPHRVASRDEWLQARLSLLAREKDLTRQRDDLARERRALPWVRLDKDYLFDAPEGPVALGDLFAGRSQLIVQHFMFAPEWEEGCKGCSFMADHTDSTLAHLAQRDVSLVAVSRAPIAAIERFRQRMGWRFRWVSSNGNAFNRDFGVTFDADDLAQGAVSYNYKTQPFGSPEAPGISAFYRDPEGTVFHTYSTFGRGVELMMGTYQLLDIAPRGRNEEGLDMPMAWVRHHDRYQPSEAVAPAACCARAG